MYRYYDAEGKVIYVGKAKDLHKRVAQYFVPPERLNTKTRILVSKIADAQFSVVDSEADALLLENNLIKQYKPKYNILLKTISPGCSSPAASRKARGTATLARTAA